MAYIRHKVETEIHLFSSEIDEQEEPQPTDIYQRSVSSTSQSSNNDSRSRHRWNPFGRVKNKLHHINRGY